MKKIISAFLILSFVLSLTACGRSEPKEISCEEIIEAYKNEGYNVEFHNHDDPIYYDSNQSCQIMITDPKDPENNYLYITRYFTEKGAKAASRENEFNPVLWMFFSIFGEHRWLITGHYGDLTYETFDMKMLKPLKELTK